MLAKLSNEKGLKKGTSKIEDYIDVVAKFSGIPQPEIAQIFAYDVYKVLSTGFNEFGIEIEMSFSSTRVFIPSSENDFSPRLREAISMLFSDGSTLT